MNIYYHRRQKQWGHRELTKNIAWGRQNKELPLKPFAPDAVDFSVQINGNKIGPLIGILTNSKGMSFAGNREMFEQIHNTLQNIGGVVFVFTPEQVKSDRIKGHWFNTKKQTWEPADFPFPDVVYNRIPFRRYERTDAVQTLLKQLDLLNISYFNPRFFNKAETYELFWEDDLLRRHLPETYHLNDAADIEHALMRHGNIYLKPENGRKGDGIFTLAFNQDRTILCRSNKRTLTFDSLQELWDHLEPQLAKKRYLIQQTIDLQRFNERPFDFRILIQKLAGTWSITGIGARLAGQESITTHVPKGGELLELGRIQPFPDIDFLTHLSKRAAFVLERKFPSLAECSLDIGRDKAGHYWIFEANAKPMEFDEEDIEIKRMDRLIKIFFEKSGFQ